MRFKVLGLAAAMALALAACASTPDSTANSSGSGDKMAHKMTTETAPAKEMTLAEKFQVDVGDRVFFDFDKFNIKPDQRKTLDRQVAWLKAHPEVLVTIEGHTDERGTREYNLALGERRANSVKDYLVLQGISAKRLKTVSYGEERPVALGSNEAAWAQNRRAVTVVAAAGS